MYDAVTISPDQVHENRVKGVAFLRTTGMRQGIGQMIDSCGCVCALGGLALAVGLDPAMAPYAEVEAAYGLTIHESDEITQLNDGSFGTRLSLPAIGDKLAAKWGID